MMARQLNLVVEVLCPTCGENLQVKIPVEDLRQQLRGLGIATTLAADKIEGKKENHNEPQR